MNKPISNFDDTGLPAWQEIDRIISEDKVHLSQMVRDELAGMLVWARYGKNIGEGVNKEMIDNGCEAYSEGGCMGLDSYERREVVEAILRAAIE